MTDDEYEGLTKRIDALQTWIDALQAQLFNYSELIHDRFKALEREVRSNGLTSRTED